MASIASRSEEPLDDSAEARELEKLLKTAQEIENDDFQHALDSGKESFSQGFKNTPNISSANETTAKKLNIINDDIDSSDEEEMKNFLERKYNEYGRDINNKLKQDRVEKHEATISKYVNASFSDTLRNSIGKNQNRESRLSHSFKEKPVSKPLIPIPIKIESPVSYFTDPIFGLRIIRPLVSGTFLKQHMEGRTPIGMSSLEHHLERGDLSKDWVLAGVIVGKTPLKKTKKGDAFSIWRLSDLKGDMKTVSLFLFRAAHKELCKTAEGVAIAVLNPGVFNNRKDHNDLASLTIDTAQKVMILGQSKDLGKCKSRKKNGEPCTAIVNVTDCEYCVYHVKQEFNKMSMRSELQSSTAGRGLQELRNKVLGKSEVFYGGKSFTAVPAKKSAKQIAKDEKRLMTLSDYYQSPFARENSQNMSNNNNQNKKPVTYASSVGPVAKTAMTIDQNNKQRQKDLDRLKLLRGAAVTDENKNAEMEASVSNKYQNREFSFSQTVPTLSHATVTLDIDLSTKKANMAKMKAVAAIKKKPVVKTDPNFVKYRGTLQGKKRAIDLMNEEVESESKRRKIEENERKSRIQKIIDATSAHTNLIKSREDEERDKYFNKMEKKEAMEEKMLSTYRIACKAVKCVQCKYIAFSAADRCKEEKHTLKVVDAEKRFFECQDCGNRTVSVHKLPVISCKNCSGSRWKRAAMIREKKAAQGTELSIRGDEEKFIGSTMAAPSLNLLVPVEE